MRGRGWGGVAWVPGKSPDTCITGDWGVELHGSFVSKILQTTIAIQPFIQNCTCKMGSSIFAAMIRLKFVSMTRAPLPSMPPAERTSREKCF